MSSFSVQKKITVPFLKAKKATSKITMLTAYDFPTAKCLDEGGIDVVLVGDSLGTVIYGEPNTLKVTLEDIIRHTQAVSRACSLSFVLADMPFLSYQVNPESALINAGRLIKESGAEAVKLEGGKEITPTVEKITRAGIPVCGHIGLTPQSIHAMGSYRMHGKTVEERDYLIESAIALENAGAFLLVLECVEPSLASEITKKISIPTIGIGSGEDCDGQVLVFHDLVGLTVGRVPKFVKPTAQIREVIQLAIQQYIHRTTSSQPQVPGLRTTPMDRPKVAGGAKSAEQIQS